MNAWTGELAMCPECDRAVKTYVPAGGDGSMTLFAVHGPAFNRCPQSRTEVRDDWVVDP